MTRMPGPVPHDGHAGHDPLLIAAHAAGDASGADLDRAAALVATCHECAWLHRDLRAVSAALAASAAPSRPRDFRLTSEQAAELARPAGWRRLLAPFAGTRSAAGPLAATLAALGLAGVLLGGGLQLGAGGAAMTALAPEAGPSAAPADMSAGQGNADQAVGQVTSGGAAMPSAAASAAAALASAAPSIAEPPLPSLAAPMTVSAPTSVPTAAEVTGSGKAASNAEPSLAPTAAPASSGEAYVTPARSPGGAGVPPGAARSAEEVGGPSPVLLGSLVLLVAGVALGLLRLAARRLL